MSSKDTEKNFVGQPIFKQLVDLLPKSKFDILALEHKTDHYYKAFPAWTQLVTMLFGVFSRCDSPLPHESLRVVFASVMPQTHTSYFRFTTNH